MINMSLLAENYFDTLHTAHRSLRSAFETRELEGFTRDDLAEKLGVDKALISRRLSGSENFTLKTLSHMASGLGYCVVVKFVREDDIRSSGNQYSPSWGNQAALQELYKYKSRPQDDNEASLSNVTISDTSSSKAEKFRRGKFAQMGREHNNKKYRNDQ